MALFKATVRFAQESKAFNALLKKTYRPLVTVRETLSSKQTKFDYADPYSVFSIIVYDILMLYDVSVWSMRNHICKWEAVCRYPNPVHEQAFTTADTKQDRQSKADYPLLHEMARHMVHVSETLAVALHSLQGLQVQQDEFAKRYLRGGKSKSKAKNNFHFQAQLLQSLMARSESNKARLQNEINLAFNAEAQRDSKVQVRIAEEARKKTASMKAIAVVTMIFLPSTFVASSLMSPMIGSLNGESESIERGLSAVFSPHTVT
ncbi:MAG: hypothetical protein Q9168_006347 [Polycauliona sp. 1 TL-2023]